MYFSSPPSEPVYRSVPLIPVHESQWSLWRASQSLFVRQFLELNRFSAKEGQWAIVPDPSGKMDRIIFGYGNDTEIRWCLGDLVNYLPVAYYHLECDWSQYQVRQAALGWGLGQYDYNRFKSGVKSKSPEQRPQLFVPSEQAVEAYVDAIYLVRDLINTPANHLMPQHLTEVVKEVAGHFDAELIVVSDNEAMQKEYPAVHAVGRASKHKPRMIKMTWGNPEHPELALVGKGVCYDTGGLDIKPSKFMRNMKKDMGGAAHVLGLASIIMSLGLPVHLKLYIPAADNAISDDAFRPGDVIDTRLGKTVEIDNTDAEGRLLLCDALADACTSKPDLIVDFATLTGAARVALGTEVPVYFTNSGSVEDDLRLSANNAAELIWPLPLYKPYTDQLNSQVADLQNSSPEGYGGAITAALFLSQFVDNEVDWVHFDVMAWNNRNRPGRPAGGEAMGLFAVADYLWSRYG